MQNLRETEVPVGGQKWEDVTLVTVAVAAPVRDQWHAKKKGRSKWSRIARGRKAFTGTDVGGGGSALIIIWYG